MSTASQDPELRRAYEVCRQIARREAKNFYYAFRVLPAHKSDAMCAIYAFMRRADDIADDESMPVERRRVVMQTWLAGWRTARASGTSEDPVFYAVADTRSRFNIPIGLLEELVQGTNMDLGLGVTPGGGSMKLAGGLEGYATFEDLYRYCYLVASVVGLVCIRIFGYSDPEAELLAERTGIAFQLTNILRDVKEDVERGRIYLPQEMLRRHGIADADVVELAKGRSIRPNERALIEELSGKAWEYYGSVRKLLPLIDADSRAALWVLAEIYSTLLKEVDARQGDVFSRRVSVPRSRKVLALVSGALMALRQKL